ncbi:hypothetical protein FXO37_22149 [Capsicum annuum]|nr:hypothetical protein FXO37_22149 [Capsicum annuum]
MSSSLARWHSGSSSSGEYYMDCEGGEEVAPLHSNISGLGVLSQLTKKLIMISPLILGAMAKIARKLTYASDLIEREKRNIMKMITPYEIRNQVLYSYMYEGTQADEVVLWIKQYFANKKKKSKQQILPFPFPKWDEPSASAFAGTLQYSIQAEDIKNYSQEFFRKCNISIILIQNRAFMTAEDMTKSLQMKREDEEGTSTESFEKITPGLSTLSEVVVWTAYTLPSPDPTLWEYRELFRRLYIVLMEYSEFDDETQKRAAEAAKCLKSSKTKDQERLS